MKGLEKRSRHKDRPPETYAIANVTAVQKCVGAFRRPCVQLTSAVLCDECWDYVASVPAREWKGMAT